MTNPGVCYCGAYGGGVHTKSARCVDVPGPKQPPRIHGDGCICGDYTLSHCPVKDRKPPARELPPSKDKLTFSMGNGQRKFTASADGDILRITIQDGEQRHEWFYLDIWEARKLRDLCTTFLSATPEPPGVAVTALRRIIDEGDYTAPEGMTRIAREALEKIGNSAPPPAVWQPIETAPKRGYIIGAYQYGTDRWAVHCMWWDDQVEEWTDVYSDRYVKPTQWAPTPTKEGSHV